MITKDNGNINIDIIKKIVQQVAKIIENKSRVLIVSSGAVGAGRAIVKLKNEKDEVVRRQAFSAVGQIELMRIYKETFKQHNLNIAQVLCTREDFRTRNHYVNMKNCFSSLLDNNIIPIVNENDTIAVSELMFTDNDELAGLVAGIVNADILMILSNVEGVMDLESNRLIKVIEKNDKTWKHFVVPSKSTFGRGGMITKCSVAEKLADIGITTHIVDGEKENILVDVMCGKNVGTTFLAGKKISSVKKWLATSNGSSKGVIYINECIEKKVCSENKTCSLLPIGVVKIEGNFKKNDILTIKNENGEYLGVGKAEYGDDIAERYVGKKGKRAIVHYDYLYLSNNKTNI